MVQVTMNNLVVMYHIFLIQNVLEALEPKGNLENLGQLIKVINPFNHGTGQK